MKIIYKNCKACNGDGYIEEQDWDNATTAGTPIKAIMCTICNGNGLIKTDYILVEE